MQLYATSLSTKKYSVIAKWIHSKKTQPLGSIFLFLISISPTPCTALLLRRNKQSTRKIKPRAGTVLVPPANRRVEFNGSGAPSGMMAQPQPA